ncbi:MAG: TrmH family RNA methyltransferase [Clostridium sp.]
MITIESSKNTIFKENKKLKDRKGRNKAKKFIIEGIRLVEEGFKANISFDHLMITDEGEKRLEEYNSPFISKDIKTYKISNELFLELCETETPQGVLAIANMENSILKRDGEFYILCDKVQDPGNLGTIIRTAHAVGVDGIILTKGSVDIYNEKVLRSTMGSIFYVPVVYDDEEFSLIKDLKNSGYSILATSLEGDKNFFEENLKGKLVVTVGNEGNGVSDEVYALSDKKVKIPMPGGAESLNVAIATSVVLYEKLRQNLI